MRNAWELQLLFVGAAIAEARPVGGPTVREGARDLPAEDSGKASKIGGMVSIYALPHGRASARASASRAL